MTDPDYLWLVLAMSAVTYLPRLLPLVALSDRSLPPGVSDWLDLVPVAILAALLAPALCLDEASRTLVWGKTELFAAMLTLLFALKTRSLGGAVMVGMASFWFFSVVL